MATATLAPCLWQQFCDDEGTPLVGGFLYTYDAGTTTPKATYTSHEGTVAHENPIKLDSGGFVPNGGLWLTAGKYKFILQDSSHTVVRTIDNVSAIGGSGDNTVVIVDSIDELRALDEAAAAIVIVNGYYERADGGGGIFAWVANDTSNDDNGIIIVPNSQPQSGRWKRLYDGDISIRWFGAKGDGATDDKDAINAAHSAAIAYGKKVVFTSGTYYTTALSPNHVVYKLLAGAKLKWTQISRPRLVVEIAGSDTTEHFECDLDYEPHLICEYVRPEWFHGEHALRQAINACHVWHNCVPFESPYVKLSSDTYNIGNEGDYTITKDYVKIVGPSFPIVYKPSITTSFKAAVGAVIRGRLSFSSTHVELRNLSIDVGMNVCMNYYNDERVNAIEVKAEADTIHNVIIDNVTTLGYKRTTWNTDNGICGIKLTNVANYFITNVVVDYFDYAVKITGYNGIISNLLLRNPYFYGLVFVNDDRAGSDYGLTYNVNVANVSVLWDINETATPSAVYLRNNAVNANHMSNIAINGLSCYNCAYSVKIDAGSGLSYVKDVTVFVNNSSVQSSISGSSIDYKTLRIINNLSGDGKKWIGSEIDVQLHNAALSLGASQLDTAVIKLLDTNETTGALKDMYNADNYKSIGVIKAHEDNNGKWHSKLTLDDIEIDEARSIKSKVYQFSANNIETNFGYPLTPGVFKTNGGANGIELTFEYGGVNKDNAVTLSNTYCVVMNCAYAGLINLSFTFVNTLAIDKIYVKFKGSYFYMSPRLGSTSGVHRWYIGYSDFTINPYAELAGNNSYFVIKEAILGYFAGSSYSLSMSLTYPIAHE